MKAVQKSVVMVNGKQYTVWSGREGVFEVTKDAPRTRMGFRRVCLTSKTAQAAIAKATGSTS